MKKKVVPKKGNKKKYNKKKTILYPLNIFCIPL